MLHVSQMFFKLFFLLFLSLPCLSSFWAAKGALWSPGSLFKTSLGCKHGKLVIVTILQLLVNCSSLTNQSTARETKPSGRFSLVKKNKNNQAKFPPTGQMGEQNCQVPMEEAFVLSVESSTSSHGEQELLLLLLLQVSAVLICLLGSFLLVLLLWRASKQQQQQSKNKPEFLLPPGSLGLPVVGETLQYIKSMSTANPTFMKEHQRRQKSLASQPALYKIDQVQLPFTSEFVSDCSSLSVLNLFKNWCHVVVVHLIIRCWNARHQFWSCCLPACLPVHMQVWRLVQVKSVGCLVHHPNQTWNDQVGAQTRRQTLHHRLSQVLQESLRRACSSECGWGLVEECQKVHQQQLTRWASPSLSLPP